MNESVISANDLSLTFETNDGPVHALQDINLDIEKGEFVSFIGPSGCGKTTLLRVIADLETPTKGVVKVNDMSASQARMERAYGYVFQAAGLYPWRTIGGNIKLPLEIMGYDKLEQKERVTQVLELVELSGFDIALSGDYPGWQPNINSEILEIVRNIYEELHGEKAHVAACHAGLECGILGQNYPKIDMISFGPTIKGAHSPDEKVSIPSVDKFWKFLVEILKNTPKP